MNLLRQFLNLCLDALREYASPLRWLLLSVPVVALLCLAGIGLVALARSAAGAAAPVLRGMGLGMILLGALLVLFVTLRVWWMLFRVAGFISNKKSA